MFGIRLFEDPKPEILTNMKLIWQKIEFILTEHQISRGIAILTRDWKDRFI